MSFDKLFPSNVGKFPWSVNKVSPAQQRNSPIIVYFPFHSMQETRAYWNYSCGATTEPWHTQRCGELQPCIFHLAWQGADDRRGERDRGHYHRQQQKKRKKHVTCVGLAERNSFEESVPTVRTCLRFPHTRSPEPCPSWTASPRVTSLQRRVEEKGEMWTPCFSKNNGVSQKGIFF